MRETLPLHDLAPGGRERFLERWKAVQLAFVDSPRGALTEADDVVFAAMQARGYPVADFEQRAWQRRATGRELHAGAHYQQQIGRRLSCPQLQLLDHGRVDERHYQRQFRHPRQLRNRRQHAPGHRERRRLQGRFHQAEPLRRSGKASKPRAARCPPVAIELSSGEVALVWARGHPIVGRRLSPLSPDC